jgi:hypothetical protein
MTRKEMVWIAAIVAIAANLSACGQQQTAGTAPRVERKRLTLTPSPAAFQTAFLWGELHDLHVTQQLKVATGEPIRPPVLTTTLVLKNTSEDMTARLVSGELRFLDRDGNRIPVRLGGENASFKFWAHSGERIDPGQYMSQSVEVPFPVAALKGAVLSGIQLELEYVPMPYKTDVLAIAVALPS